ncbi:MAG TPA: MDR family MFS transporter [Microlunatus sp.]|nr:MDR family MFS transporter [Microlunatus sp.]
MSRAEVGLRSSRGPILLSMMLSVGLVAIDSTILATAVPSIVGDLGGFHQFPWLFSIFLLAQAVSVPIFAKFSDQYGRKPIMLIGVGLFLLGSILSGIAWSMPALIVFRGLQGLGAGAIMPTSMTIVGDLYSVAERATVQGYMASVWAISAVVGPALGGIFVETLSWRWIFFVNIPLALFAGWTLLHRFHENIERVRHRIDVGGAVLLTAGSSLLILGLLEGGVLWPWQSVASVVVLGGAVVLLVGFALLERRASEPIIPGWIVRARLLNTTNLVSLSVGAMLVGLTSYVPLYVQGVLGHNALVGGFAVAALTIGWPIAASTAGRIYLRIGFRNTALIGSAVALVGAGLLATLAVDSSVWLVAATCFVVGLGMGWIASPTLIAAQSAADWQVRGVVTGTNMFARSMGSAVGIAVFGALANASLAGSAGAGGHGSISLDGVDPAQLFDALHRVFVGSAVVALVMLLGIALMPRKPGEHQLVPSR